MLLGVTSRRDRLTPTGVLPAMPCLPRTLQLQRSCSSTGQQPDQDGPTTPHMQRLSALTHIRFGLFRVRSPLLTESLLFSLPAGTEMFHFPAFPPTALYIQAGVAGHDSGSLRGFPIRTSPDQRSFTNSPGLIAGSHVLHRLLVPRHPPTALSSLSTHTTPLQDKSDTPTKMLAPTVKFSTHQQPPPTPPPHGSRPRSPP